MKVLIAGGGGREHALAWKAAQSEKVSEVLVAPGNAGTAREVKVRNVAIAADNIDELLQLARDEQIDLTIVGPEAPLVAGIVDRFGEAGLRCFGPSAPAARLEGSKAFMKAFLQRNHIPTAHYEVFDDMDAAIACIRKRGAPVVVKADGLAAGKGVIVAQSIDEAEKAVRDMLADSRFGQAGHRVVIEDFLAGEEASFIAMVDGKTILPLATSQDHKARDNGDRGPNTGGMGAYSPAPVITPQIHDQIMSEIMLPTVRAMADDGTPYTGFLYAGVMIDDDGIARVLEFNCRLGDPETQPIMMRLKSDLVDLCLAAAEGRLNEIRLDWDPRCALGVVMAAGGYPDQYAKGDVISGLDSEHEDTKVFHAGTRIEDHNVVTDGGRVLCVAGLGASTVDAQKKAYQRVKKISWDKAYYRDDIGYRAIKKNPPGHSSAITSDAS
ncbi:MAG: phosphoribosylamine--glycine ligase [Gammaproteobacteria bacterium]|nr:phosphoribosylamine--glycine ligase [Gammaproteobacteria bacterium]